MFLLFLANGYIIYTDIPKLSSSSVYCFSKAIKPLTCRISFMVLFLEKQPKSKGPDGYSVNRKLLASGIAIDFWGGFG